MMNLTRLNEVIGTNRIFATLMDGYTLPWSEDTSISAQTLDFEYLYNYSGRKVISPAVERCVEDGEIPAADFAQLCNVAYMMFNKKWERNWAILTMEYNPIENYSMTEHQVLTRDNSETHSGTDQFKQTGTDTHAESGTNTLLMTGTDTHAESGKDTIKNTGTDTSVKSGSEALVKTGSSVLTMAGSETDTHTGGYTDTNNNVSTEHEVSAINSSGYSDGTKDTTTGNTSRVYNTDQNTKTFSNRTDTTQNNNLTDTTTYNNVTDAETKNLQDETTYGHQDQETRNMSDATTFGHTDTETLNRTDQTIHGHQIDNDDTETTDHTRSGNIGVTSQQMAESDLNLWRWNFFYEVFNDIDHVFTITTY